MSAPEEAIQLARGRAETIVGLAAEMLLTGTDLSHVQAHYVIPAIELLSEAEAVGVLAAGGDRDAGEALDRIAHKLSELRDEALLEIGASEGGEL